MKPRDVEKIVKEQGFVLLPKKAKGSHRRYQNPDGRITEIPFHSGDIPKGLLKAIFKQIGYDERS